MEEVTMIKGPIRGPTSVILAGVHGDEPCGIEAFEAVLPLLRIQAGTVYFVIGNPLALKQKKRFADFNLNRAFKSTDAWRTEDIASYEYGRAQFLMTYLDKATALLDIHSSMTPRSIPFVICENNGVDIASYLPGNLIVSGFDTVSPGGTDEYMNRHNRIGICIECGQHMDPSASSIAVSAIHAFLARRGHTTRAFPRIQKQRIRVFEMYRTKTDSFERLYNWGDFETVPNGAIIGIDGTEEVRAQKDSFILFARDRSQIGAEAFLLAESVN